MLKIASKVSRRNAVSYEEKKYVGMDRDMFSQPQHVSQLRNTVNNESPFISKLHASLNTNQIILKDNMQVTEDGNRQ